MSRPPTGNQATATGQPPGANPTNVPIPRAITNAIEFLQSKQLLLGDEFPTHEALAQALNFTMENTKKTVELLTTTMIVRNIAQVIRHLGHQQIRAQAIKDTVQALAEKLTKDLGGLTDGMRTNAELLNATAEGTRHLRVVAMQCVTLV